MRRHLQFFTLAALLAVAANSLIRPAHAQTATVADFKAMADTVKTLQDQQQAIAANQAKIDDKLAAIAEDIRVARIYAARVR